MKQTTKKLLLSSALVFCGLIINHQDLHANNMQQKAIKATIGQSVTTETAKALIEDKTKLAEYQKDIKGQGLDMTADEYIIEKTAAVVDDGISQADRMKIEFIQRKALFNKLTNKGTVGYKGLSVAEVKAAIRAAGAANIDIKNIMNTNAHTIEAAKVLAGAREAVNKHNVEVVIHLLYGNRGARLAGVDPTGTAPQVEAALALAAPSDAANHNSTQLPIDKITGDAVLAVASTNTIADVPTKAAVHAELLWAIRHGYAGHPAGTVPNYIAWVEDQIGPRGGRRTASSLQIKWTRPTVGDPRAHARYKDIGAKEFWIYYDRMDQNGSKLKTTGLVTDTYVVFDNIINDRDASRVDRVEFDHGDQH